MSTQTHSSRQGRSAPRLSLEPLEDRSLLSTYSFTDLTALLGTGAQVYGLNDSGHLVGSVSGRAFLYADGTLTDLGTLGGSTSRANAVNNLGQVVGSSAVDSANPSVAFLWQNDVLSDLGLGNPSSAAAVNDSGYLVGSANGAAFLWQDGVVTDLGNLGGPGGARATDINNAGQVVGSASSTLPSFFGLGNADHAFIWQDGVMTSLANSFTVGSTANAVNNLGQVVGSWTVYLNTGYGAAFVTQAFFYDGSGFVSMGIPSVQSNAFDINDSGQVVGSMSGGAFIYEGGKVRNLNTLIVPGSGITLTMATDINNAGQIIAYASNGRYYLLTPEVPAEGPEVQLWVGGVEVADDTGAVDFGSVLRGTTVTRTFVVRNVGNETLTLSGPIGLPAGFTLVSGFNTTSLAPGGLAQFVVRMPATTVGNFGGEITFGTNDADEGAFNFTVSASVARVIDDGESGFTSFGFSALSGQGNKGDLRRAARGTGSAYAQWLFTGLEAGTYRVSATWVAGTDRATNAPFTVSSGSTSLGTVAVNQRQAPDDFIADGVAWEELGTFTISGGSLAVRLTNLADGMVIADSIRLERVPDTTA